MANISAGGGFSLYPGGIAVKRLGYIALMFSIGFNVFLDDLQDMLVKQGTVVVENMSALSGTASYWAEFYEEYVDRIPFVGSPERLEQAKTTKETVRQTQEFASILRPAASIIKVMSIFIWLPILVVAIPWLTLDLICGSASTRRFVSITLLLAAPFNALVYLFLHQSFAQALEGSGLLMSVFGG